MPDPAPLMFKASLYRVNLDHEGESKVTFAIPLSELPQVLKIGELTQTELIVVVKQAA